MAKSTRPSLLWFCCKAFIRVTVGAVLVLALTVAVLISYFTRPDVLAGIVRDEISARMNAPVSIGSIGFSTDGTIVIDDVVIDVDPNHEFLSGVTHGNGPSTQPADADTRPAGPSTRPASTQAASTQSASTQTASTQPASTQPDPDRPEFDPRAARFLRIRRIVICENPARLIALKPFIESITISRPTLYVVENLDNGQYNLKSLRFNINKQPAASSAVVSEETTAFAKQTLTAIAPSVPPVTIEGARIYTAVIEKGVFRPVGDMRLRADLRPDFTSPGTYKYDVKEFKDKGRGNDIWITGYLNPEKQIVAGKIDGLELQKMVSDYLPDRYRRYWEQLEPQGKINQLTFSYSPDSGVGVSLGLTEGAITLDALTSGIDQVHRRLTEVDLNIVFQKDWVAVERFRGRLGMLTYEAKGKLSGLTASSPFELQLAINPFVIPENPEDLHKLPALVQKYYRRLKPSGTFSTEFTARRTTTGAQVQYQGSVQISNAKVTYADFAYPIHNLYGRIHFSNEEARIDKMTGLGPSGAKLGITGYFRPPGDGAEVVLNITGNDIPLDDHLRAAFGPNTLKIYDMVRDQDLYKQFLQRGVLTDNPDKAFDTAPYFKLDGTVSMVTTVTRDLGLDSKYKTTVRINAKGGKVLFRYWPYPLTLTQGTIVVSPPNVILEDVGFHCPTGASGIISGSIDGGETPETPLNPSLRIKVTQMPINPLFKASLPADYSELLHTLGLAGTVGVEGRVFQDPVDKGIDFRLDTTLVNGSAKLSGGERFALDKLEAEAIVSRNGVEFKELRGSHNNTKLSMVGEVRVVEKKKESRLFVEFFDLNLQDPFWELIPPESAARKLVQESLDRYKVAGVVSGTLYLQNIKPKEPPLQGRIEPKSLAANYGTDRIELNDMTGAIDFDMDELRFDRLGLNLGYTTAELRGTASFNKPGEFDIFFDAKGPNLLPPTTYLIPVGMRGAIDALELRTGFDIVNANFKGKRRDDGKINIAVAGTADLRNTTLRMGTLINIPKSRVVAAIGHAPEMTLAQSAVQLTAPAVNLLGRSMDNLFIQTTTNGKDPIVQIQKVTGGLYGGTATISGKFDASDAQAFDLNLVVDNAQVDPLLNPGAAAQKQANGNGNGNGNGNANGNGGAGVASAQPADQKKPKMQALSEVINAGGNIVGDVFRLGNDAIGGTIKATEKTTQAIMPGNNQPQTLPSALKPSDDTPIAPQPNAGPKDARLSVALKVSGSANDTNTYKGKGTLIAKGLDGKSLPAAMAVFHVINLRFPDAQAFSQMDARARIEGKVVWFSDILVRSPSIELVGNGAMNWKTQTIDFRLTTQAPKALDLGPISAIINTLRDQIISIRVDGTLGKPNAYIQPLSGIIRVFEGNTSPDAGDN